MVVKDHLHTAAAKEKIVGDMSVSIKHSSFWGKWKSAPANSLQHTHQINTIFILENNDIALFKCSFLYITVLFPLFDIILTMNKAGEWTGLE